MEFIKQKIEILIQLGNDELTQDTIEVDAQVIGKLAVHQHHIVGDSCWVITHIPTKRKLPSFNTELEAIQAAKLLAPILTMDEVDPKDKELVKQVRKILDKVKKENR